MLTGLAAGLAMVSFLVALMALTVACWALVEVFAYKRSTHNVQFITAEDALKEKEQDAELNKKIQEDLAKAMRAEFGEERDEQQ